MKHRHEDIKERLPEYFSGTLSEEEKAEIGLHLSACPDCKEELVLIAELNRADVPEPGEFFWKSLPQRVQILSREQKKSSFSFKMLLRPAPLTAFVFLIAISIFSLTYKQYFSENYSDPLFIDPLSASFFDYSTLNDKDLAEVTESLTIEDNDINILGETYYEDSYHKDLASLSSEEVNRLYQALNNQQKNGGVI